jgi:hypothetical protein
MGRPLVIAARERAGYLLWLPLRLLPACGPPEAYVGGHLQHSGYLAGMESEDVTQDEDGDLARRQQLQGATEAS